METNFWCSSISSDHRLSSTNNKYHYETICANKNFKMNAHTFEKVKIEAVEVLIEVRITENRLSNPIKLIKSIKYPSVHQH